MDNSGFRYNCGVYDVLRYDVVVIQKQKLQIFIAFNTPTTLFRCREVNRSYQNCI